MWCPLLSFQLKGHTAFSDTATKWGQSTQVPETTGKQRPKSYTQAQKNHSNHRGWKEGKKKERITKRRQTLRIKWKTWDSRDIHQHQDRSNVQRVPVRHTWGLWVKTVTRVDRITNIFATVVRSKPIISDKAMTVLSILCWFFFK